MLEFYHRPESMRSLKCLEEELNIIDEIINFNSLNSKKNEYFELKHKMILSEINVF